MASSMGKVISFGTLATHTQVKLVLYNIVMIVIHDAISFNIIPLYPTADVFEDNSCMA